MLLIAALAGVAAIATFGEPRLPLESPAIAEPEVPQGPRLGYASGTDPAPAPPLSPDLGALCLSAEPAATGSREGLAGPATAALAAEARPAPLAHAPKASPPARS